MNYFLELGWIKRALGEEYASRNTYNLKEMKTYNLSDLGYFFSILTKLFLFLLKNTFVYWSSLKDLKTLLKYFIFKESVLTSVKYRLISIQNDCLKE